MKTSRQTPNCPSRTNLKIPSTHDENDPEDQSVYDEKNHHKNSGGRMFA
jgi:hypothetical protein